MARKSREISKSGIYHVMLRGVNKQRIFEHVEDYEGFLRILKEILVDNLMQAHSQDPLPQRLPDYDVYAYCLMDNHVHMLIGVNNMESSVGDLIKRISGRYAQFFNWRYNRVGHLFQDRFRSEVCEDETYFFTLMNYIHYNPVKAGICAKESDYTYSSCKEILGEETDEKKIICTHEIKCWDIKSEEMRKWCLAMQIQNQKELKQVTEATRKGIDEEYQNLQAYKDKCDRPTTSSDQDVLQKITQWGLSLLCNLRQAKEERVDADMLDKLITETLVGLSGVDTIAKFQQLDKATMRSTLAIVRDAGISIKRLSRISGISEGIIRYCKNPENYIKGTDPIV